MIQKFVELFHAMTLPPKKSVQGFWAELFLISRSSEPKRLMRAWHRFPEDRYDFNDGDQRLEVKSAAGRVRKHHFSHEQMHPPTGTTLMIVSLFVERAGAGVSVGDLMERIRPRIVSDADLLDKLDRSLPISLGNSWENAVDARFDAQLAEDSLAAYDARQVPAISAVLPARVSEVHFTSDLTECQSVPSSALRSLGGLFAAM